MKINLKVLKLAASRLGIVLGLSLLVFQQAAAITADDVYCQNQGDFGGTCGYDPNAACNGSSSSSDQSEPTQESQSGISINNQAAQQIAQQASTGTANVGYALYNSSGSLLAHYNDTFENYGASITKSMILVAYLNQLGSGTLSPTVTSEITGMIEQSDDQDANDVFNLLSNPESEIEAVAQQAGMQGFKYNDQADSVYYLGQSQINANDFAKFFSKIDSMFPPSQKDFALNLLSNIQQQVGLLQAGLPGTIYSKEGWKPEPGTVDDSARSGSPNPFGAEGVPYIVNQAAQFSDGGTTYGVSVTVGGAQDEVSGEAIVKNVVSALISSGGSSSQPSSSSLASQGVSSSSCCPSTSSAGATLTAAQAVGKSTWAANVQPPYYLEEYIINILEDLAQTLNVPQTDTVTQAHVLAMVAWAQAEGGNLVASDPNYFNIWNSGPLEGHSDLYVGGGGNSDGTGTSFASFDDGVEGFAIVFTGSYQSRIGTVLSQPNSTAGQVLSTIANPSLVSGNMEWATDPNYYNSLTQDLQTTRQNYAQLASVVIGPGQYSTSHVSTSKLQYSSGSGGSDSGSANLEANDTTGSSSTCSCSGSTTTAASNGEQTAVTSSSSGPTIVLDPGHATSANEDVDPATDEPVFDYSNPIEQRQVWDMALSLKTKLTAAGYNVLITKNSENDTNTNLKERAEVGNNADAALGVSLHTTPGSVSNGNDVFYPVVGEYLVKVNGKHDVYTNTSLSNTDQQDAQTMSQSLTQASGITFRSGGYGQIYGPITRYAPDGSGTVMHGTMLVTQYFATVPWVYLERYQDSSAYGTTTQTGMNDYETGVLNGIEKIVPAKGGASSTDSSSSASTSGCSSGGTNCLTASGDAKILCEAVQYQGLYYRFGGGHTVANYTQFAASCPDPANPPANPPNQPFGAPPIDGGKSGNPNPCAVDCSALVSFAVDEAFGLNYTWTVSTDALMVDDGAQYWKKISIAQAQPGDIVTLNDATGHVEVVDHVSGNNIYTMGARETGTKDSIVSQPLSTWTYAWHWTGPGSTN